MKPRIVVWTVVSILSVSVMLTLSLAKSLNTSGVIMLSCLSIVSIALVVYDFLIYIKSVLGKTSLILNQNETIRVWDFGNIKRVNEQLTAITKKQTLAADYVSMLGDENFKTMDDLIARDKIGESIHALRAKMEHVKEEEHKRNWVSEGLAKFSEILRNKSEIKEYGHLIISNLVRYLGANQGGFFIAQSDQDDRYLELVACYAYDKRKFIESRINEGQGLLGQCMLEKDFIFITDVPASYVKITSGLGEATPRNIVVAPLIFNDQFYGVLEIASFEVLKPHQIDFLKKVTQNIAAEIASIKTYTHTKILLQESEQLTGKLKEQEEELKINIEELATTQEEMRRKQNELNSYLSAINNTIAAAEFDLSGNFVTGNDIFLKVMAYSAAELKGHNYRDIMKNDSSVNMMWDNLKTGKFFSGEFKMIDKQGKELWLNGTFNPISASGGAPEKVMMFAQFNTQEKEKVNELSGMVHALKSALPVAEFNENFICKTANEKFMNMFGIGRMELRNKPINHFMDAHYSTIFDKVKSEILTKEYMTILVPLKTTHGTVNYEASISVARSLEGKVSRIILLLIHPIEESASVLKAG